jgi:hypothetical protein
MKVAGVLVLVVDTQKREEVELSYEKRKEGRWRESLAR